MLRHPPAWLCYHPGDVRLRADPENNNMILLSPPLPNNTVWCATMESTFTKEGASTGVQFSAVPVAAEPRPQGAGACVASDTVEYLDLNVHLLSQLERPVALSRCMKLELSRGMQPAQSGLASFSRHASSCDPRSCPAPPDGRGSPRPCRRRPPGRFGSSRGRRNQNSGP